jgi:hypothetical protein
LPALCNSEAQSFIVRCTKTHHAAHNEPVGTKGVLNGQGPAMNARQLMRRIAIGRAMSKILKIRAETAAVERTS